MLYICKKDNTMTVQTAFRFSPELINRLKNRARRDHKSVNQFVEEVLEKALEDDLLKGLEGLRLCKEIPADILNMPFIVLDESGLDEKAAYILGK